MRMTVWLTTAGLLVGRSLAAQQPAASDPAALLTRGFEEVAGWVTKAAEMVPADKYAFKPAASVRTFGQLIGHLADGQNYYCARGAGRNVDWVETVEKGSQDKAVLLQKLKESIAVCTAAHAQAGITGPLIANYGHANLHYGNLVTYLRLLGMVPPTS
jgi:uncharacterized damage-inducible protein DinB